MMYIWTGPKTVVTVEHEISSDLAYLFCTLSLLDKEAVQRPVWLDGRNAWIFAQVFAPKNTKCI